MRSFLSKLVLFVVLISGLYLIVLLLAANAPGAVQKRIRERTNIPVGRIPRGSDTLVRFREAQGVADIDILFVGSSHCYRGFDPRIFARHGYATFNLGSSSQSPLNTYHLLRTRLDALRPRLIVFEVYWEVLKGDGTESALELLQNLPMSRELVEMIAATRNLTAVNGLFLRLFDLGAVPVERLEPREDPRDRYVPGGYVERDTSRTPEITFRPALPQPLQGRQLAYVRRVVKMARARGIPVVLVTQPVPPEALDGLADRHEIEAGLDRLARSCGVPLLALHRTLRLETHRHFIDADHLNARGVEVFNERLLEELARGGWLAERRIPRVPPAVG